jgi:hypothetical protein
MEFLTDVRWPPYAVGIGIGVLSWLSFLISREPISCSTSFARAGGGIERLFLGKKAESKPYYQEIKLVVGWQGMLVMGILIGSLIAALLSGDFHWQWVPSRWASAFGGSPALRVVVALVGGVFLGFGARWANGCTSGHGIGGTLQLAVSSWISAVCFFIGGILAAHFLFKIIG